MVLNIENNEIRIDDNDLTVANYTVDTFLETIKESSTDKALFMVVLLMLHKRSAELLNEYGTDNILYVLGQKYSD
jgi:hypothetical protein